MPTNPSTETVPEGRRGETVAVTVIEPSRGWRLLDLRELWDYRELLWVLAARDVQVRYKQTVLGAGWAILRPLSAMVIFTVVFGRLAKLPSDGYPYPVFVLAGLLPWNFFSNAVAAAGTSVVGSAHLISKVYFPRLIVPMASLGSPLVDLGVSVLVLLAMMLGYGLPLGPRLLAAPILVVAVAFTALGIGTLLSALSASYRDVHHLVPFLLQIWMYATPIVYPISLVPEPWRRWLYLNPMTGLTEGFRSVFLGKPLDGPAVALSVASSLLFFLAGILWFERLERRFADVI
jgi:lipopolysaccharide transport system permease protein